MSRKNVNTWIERLMLYSPDYREIIFKFLEGLDQTQIIPTVKELKRGVAWKVEKLRNTERF